jgi:hypothetical protein
MTEARTIDPVRLTDEQLVSYDMDFIDEELFASITESIVARFGDGPFSFIDVGAGIGGFVDRLLDAFPQATGVAVDNAPSLLERNVPHPRKTVVLGGAEDLERLFAGERFDIAFFNFALHHFVLPSYGATRRLQRDVLRATRGVLTERGAVSICENVADGRFVPNLPGRIVFELTARRSLARFVRRLGANTAGTGVCFNARSAWYADLSATGFSVERYRERTWSGTLSRFKRTLLTLERWRGAHLWATPRSA